jgi:hypothetical protein
VAPPSSRADCEISTLCAAEFVAQTRLVVSKNRKSLIPKEKAVLDEEKTGAGIDSARAPVT